MSMRYVSRGEVHKDFHGLTCATLHYLIENYGIESVREIMKHMAQDVYRTMHLALKSGDCSELEEWWKYYFEREGGEFSIEKLADGVRLCVTNCPALRHLVSIGRPPDSIVCDATQMLNEAVAEGSPFVADLRKTGEFSCVQTFVRRGEVDV